MPKVTLNCRQCNQPFDVCPYRLKNNVQFCSRKYKNIESLGQEQAALHAAEDRRVMEIA